jgi:hypothetical protein
MSRPVGQFLFERIPCVLVGLAVLAGVALPAREASAEEAVDLQLVIAVDSSTSMDRQERLMQRQGFVDAFRDPDVIRAIGAGRTGRIAVAYFEWGGNGRHRLVVPWTLIDGPTAAFALADDIEASYPSRLRNGTSIGGALAFAGDLLERSGFRAERSVVNVSGDGRSNAGGDLASSRRKLLARSVTINGLAIVHSDGMPDTVVDDPANALPGDHLVDYFERMVAGGPGSFVLPVNAVEDFPPAIRRKLLREIGEALQVSGLPHGNTW